MNVFTELRAGVVTMSAEETRRLGARFAAALAPDVTLAVHGDLGVGKTTFVQGLARGFGITDPVTSPTFNILHLYRGAPEPRRIPRRAQRKGERGAASPEFACQGDAGPSLPGPVTALRVGPGGGARALVHLDAYRLENAHQVSELMLEDFLVSPYCLAVEWPDRIAAWLPADALHLTLGIEAPGRHRVTLR